MDTPLKTPPAPTWLTAVQFAVSLLTAGTFLLVSVITLVMGVVRTLERGGQYEGMVFISSAGFGLLGVLAIPSAWYALLALLGRREPGRPWMTWRRIRWVIWLLPPVLLIGALIGNAPALNVVLLPALHLLAIGIPILWFLSLGTRDLQIGSLQRNWGLFLQGLIFSPIFIILLEGIAGIVLLGLIFTLLQNEPGFLNQLESIIQRIQMGSPLEPSQLIQFGEKYLLNTRVVILGLLFVGVFVPILEEALKPLGMLFLRGRKMTPAMGFVAGMLSGAGFALIESLFQAAEGPAWAFLVSGRIGTSLIHIFNSGLVGWGVALAWQGAGYGKLLWRFFWAVVIHGVWNGINILVLVGNIPDQNALPLDSILTNALIFVLPVLAGISFASLRRINRQLLAEQESASLALETAVPQMPSTSEMEISPEE